MPGTLIDYLKKYGNTTWEKMPFNEVDSLILCQLSYLKFDGMVPTVEEERACVTLEEIFQRSDYEKLYADERYEKDNRAMFECMVQGERFRKLRLNCYYNLVEKSWETQFSAITYFLSDERIYVAYRGTDETIVGWKEDFNMAYLSPIPAQTYSVKYLNIVGSKINQPIILGGHSKGGNLAVFAAMYCNGSVRKRIQTIYNMDGPGFRPKILEDGGYSKIAEHVIKIRPYSSLVGMLFETDYNYRVVDSTTFGLAQHNPYTWSVKDNHFVDIENLSESKRFMDDTINEWLYSLEEDQLRIVVDTLYQVIRASEADNLIDFTADWKKSMTGIVNALKDVDNQTADIIKKILRSLFEVAGHRFREGLDQKSTEISNPLSGRMRKRKKKNMREAVDSKG